MARKKPKQTTSKKPDNQQKRYKLSQNETSSKHAGGAKFLSIIIAIIISAVIFHSFFKKNTHRENQSTFRTAETQQHQQQHNFDTLNTTIENHPQSNEERKEAFLKWFIDNGGIFHPIESPILKDRNNNNGLNVTLAEFPSYGGWGLALSLPRSHLPSMQSDDEENINNGAEGNACKSTAAAVHVENGECQPPSSSSTSSEATITVDSSESASPLLSSTIPIIKHLQPLFTIPSTIILSIKSILETYSSPTSPSHVPNFHSRVNRILKKAFPNGPGLDAHTTMGLVEQDVVMAMYLMVEECHHHHYYHYFNQKSSSSDAEIIRDSHWGPYLDVLPQYLIPRLDTFGDEEYAVLNDDNLEYAGRNSKRLLQQMFFNGGGATTSGDGGSDNGTSLQSIVREMIRAKIIMSGPTTSSTMPPAFPQSSSTCLSFQNFHRFVAIVSSRAMVLKGKKHLSPIAEMINYKAKMPLSYYNTAAAAQNQQQKNTNHDNNTSEEEEEEGREDWIQPPFDLYHTISNDDSIIVRSDRDVYLTESSVHQFDDNDAVIQLFEDYGPVDSSLFLEAHGFVPNENPHHCAILPGSFFVTTHSNGVTSTANEKNIGYLTQALKSLNLIHPKVENFVALDDVCVKKDLSISDDGNVIGRKPASDPIAIASLLLDSNALVLVKNVDDGDSRSTLNLQRQKCINSIEARDVERIEIQCARYPGSDSVVKMALRNAALAAIGISGENESLSRLQDGQDKVMTSLLSQLHEAELHGKERMALSLRFRIEERKILVHIAKPYDIAEERDDFAVPSHGNLEEKLLDFNNFIQSLGLPINKIEPRLVGNGMRIGAFATDNIDDGSVYIALTPNAVIDIDTALIDASNTSSLLESLLEKYESQQSDDFNVLLLYLLHERFVLQKKSRWWPYLNLFPTIDELRAFHPLFFDAKEVDLYLAGSDVRRFIYRYQRSSSQRHSSLSSDLDAMLILGSDVLLDKNKFFWASAILDSRSIWWNGKRHLVPMLDLVNADGKSRAHETRLENLEPNSSQKVAVTQASREIKKGDQVYENYAQPNYSLFTYHGFLLEDNPNDCALMEGLFIHLNNPRARLLHSTTPTFCIGDENSIQQLARFLRVKHGLPLESSSGFDLDDDVRPYLVKVLMGRIDRLKDAMDYVDGTEELKARQRFMRKIVHADLMIFQHALDNYVVLHNETQA